jgi:lysophospholipase L1-like esterase
MIFKESIRMRIVQKLKPIDILITIAYCAISAFIYTGFFFPDPYTIHQFNPISINLILITVRILIPILLIGILALYYLVRFKVISMKALGLSLVTTTICLMIVIIVGFIFYTRKDNLEKIYKEYHPYLQLIPRDVSLESMDDPKAISIACLGGSTTEFVDSNGQGWPERLQDSFRDKTKGKIVNFYNLGRQWYSTLHTLINYEANIRHYKPDIIIVMHTINDLLQNAERSYFSHNNFREDYGHFYGPVNRIITERDFWTSKFGSIKLWYTTPRTMLELYDFQGLRSFHRNLDTLIDIAEIDGTRIVLMTQPYLIKKNMTDKEKSMLYMVNVETYGQDSYWSYDSALRGMEAYDNEVRAIARDRNTYLIDLEKEIPKTVEYFTDDVHYTNRAFERIAEVVERELIKQSIIR